MGYDVLQEAVKKNKENKKRRKWQQFVTCMAAIVVFCTTYALILPAITMEADLTCEAEEHQHTDECYLEIGGAHRLRCTTQEHTHDAVLCYADTEADVETEAVWEESLPEQLSGVYVNDLLLVAESQLGYSESTRNIIVEDGTLKGYSRYGAWAEDVYGDWNSYFLSFCLNYAGLDETVYPQSADYAEWMNLLNEQGLYASVESGYLPQTGDILFVDSDGDSIADRAGLVSGVTTNEENVLVVLTIEGDLGSTDNQVVAVESFVASADGAAVSDGDATVSGNDSSSIITTVQYRTPDDYAGGKVDNASYVMGEANILGFGLLPEDQTYYCETAGHVHTINCYESVLNCQVTSEEHVHDSQCYKTGALVCTTEEHAHVEECAVIPTYEYSYSDDKVQVDVKLPQDCGVPVDAKLVVTPIEESDDSYEGLVQEAEAAVEGTVSKIQFYDISFYTEDNTYIPVDDRASVSLRFTESVVDTSADVVVLHYEEDNTAPVALENVIVEELAVVAEAVEAVVEEEASAFSLLSLFGIEETAAIAELEGQTESLASEAEEAVETVEEVLNTVVTFETDGFSTFAVVQVETGAYKGLLVTPNTNANSIITIGDKSYNTITGYADNKKKYFIVSADMKYALSSYAEQDADGEDKLKGMEVLKTETVKEEDGTSKDYAYVNANEHLLWEFVGTGQMGQVYIKSVATGEYLELVRPGVAITTAVTDEDPDNRQMIQVFKDDDSNKVGFTVKVDQTFYFLNRNGGGDNYHTWTNTFEGSANNQFYLCEYQTTEADVKLPEQYPSVNMPDPNTVYMLAGVNYNSQYAGDDVADDKPTILTGESAGNQYIDTGVTNTSNLMHLAGEVADNATYKDNAVSYMSHASDYNYLWTFEETGENNVYKINRTGTADYLNIGANGLTVAGNQQGITIEAVEGLDQLEKKPVVQKDVFRLSAQVDGDTWYVFLNGNAVGNNGKEAGNDFTAINTYKDDERSPKDEHATHMVMIPYGKLVDGLEGKSYIISGVNSKTADDKDTDTSRETAVMLSTTADNTGLNDGNTGLASVNAGSTTVVDGAVTNVTVDDAVNYAWQFEDVGYGTYKIKSVETGQYLNIDNGSLTLSDTAETIEVVVANETPQTENVTKDIISLRNAEGEYVVLYDNRLGNAFTGILSTEKDDFGTNRGAQFILTEYKPTTNVSDFATDLGGQVYFVVGVNNDGGQANPPLLATTGTNNTLTGENRNVPIAKDDNSVTNVNDTNNNLGWAFIDTETPGVYYLKAANANGANKGKYLKIAASGLTMVEGIENASQIEVIKGDATSLQNKQNPAEDVVCLRTSIGGTYYYIDLINNNTNENFQSSNASADGGNHFILVEIKEVNDVVAQINNLIDNMILGTTVDSATGTSKEVYQFSDAGWWGASAIDNNNLGQQGGYQGEDDPTFVDDYNQAQAYRDEMQKKARAARAAYNNLSEAEKQYVYNSDDLIDKMEWLWRSIQTVDAVDVNATVKLFNYDGRVNTTALALNGADSVENRQGFSFYHKNEYDAYTAIIDPNRLRVDKLGGNDTALGMNPELESGYPEIKDAALANSVDGSLKYLFDNTYQVATMDNGGGLFQMDANGYYYYYANENAAYYNGTVGPIDTNNDGIADTTEVKDGGKFVLYDTVVRPMYIDGDQPNGVNDVYNFLPFNNPAESAICDPANTIPSNTNPNKLVYQVNGNEVDERNKVTGLYDSGDKNGQVKEYKGTTENIANRAKSAYLNERPDLWFGMTIDFNFVMPANGTVTPPGGGDDQAMIFDFYGDDDVFVYIDDVLVLDIGGVHGAERGTINFQTGDVTLVSSTGVTTTSTIKEYFDEAEKTGIAFNGNTFQDYSVHTLKFFYMERGGNVSYCGLKFNLPILPDNFLLAEKELSGIAPEEINFDQYYTFRVVQAELQENGSYVATNDAFFKPGTTFELWRNGEAAKDANGNKILGTTDDQGYFSVKNGYAAMFTDVLESRLNTDCSTYIVQEIIPGDEAGQYTAVNNSIITIDDNGNSETVAGTGTDTSITAVPVNGNNQYTGTHVVAGNNNTVTVNNKVNKELLSELKITKKLAQNTTADDGEAFKVKVLLGDDRITAGSGTGTFGEPTTELVPIPEGTAYTLSYTEGDTTKTEEKTVTEEGYISLQVGQTATISGLLAGTKYEVSETMGEGQEYTPSYTGTVTLKTNGVVGVGPNIDATGVSGEFGLGNIVDVTITNANYDFAANVPINKTVTYSGGADTFTFNVVEGTVDSNKFEPKTDGNLPGTTIEVSPADSSKDGSILIGYKNEAVASQKEFYYMITEQSGTGYIYDSTRYVVKVEIEEVTNADTLSYTASVTDVWTADGDGNLTDSTLKPLEPLAFKNHRTTSVTIKKTVEGYNTSDDEFEYTATVDVPIGEDYDVSFKLKDGESKVLTEIPIGSIVTVTETERSDYAESYKISAVYEAEYGTLADGSEVGATTEFATGASGGAVVVNIGNKSGAGSVSIPVVLAADTNADIDLIYESDQDRKFRIETAYEKRAATEFLNSGTWYTWPGIKYTVSNLDLFGRKQESDGTVKDDAITIYGADGQYAPNLDYIVVHTDEVVGTVATVNLLGDGSVIEFINTPLTTVTVKKLVEGSDTNEQFEFKYTVTSPDGATVEAAGTFEIARGGEYVISGVPVGSIVTVEEVDGYRYNPTYDITTKMEAEDAERRGAASYRTEQSASEGAYIGYIGEGAGNTVTFNVDSITDSKPKLSLIYTSDAERIFEVKVNNKSVISQSFVSTNSWTDKWTAGEFGEIELNRKVANAANASNAIVIGNESGAAPNLDCIELEWADQTGWVATQYVNGETTIEFTNVFYSLPQTGGTGTNLYILGGFITMLSASAALLLYNKQKRRKEENVPS